MTTEDFTLNNSLTFDIQDVMNKHLKGKRFVYRSKNGGETIGEIAEVGVGKSITWDPATSKNFTNMLNYTNDRTYRRIPRDTPEPDKIPVTNPYSAFGLTITIKSTNNISYRMFEDNIYILND